MDERCKALWEKLSAALKPQVSADTFKRWFSAVELIKATEDEVTFLVPNNIYQFWIESNHMTALQGAIVAALGDPKKVKFMSAEDGGVPVVAAVEPAEVIEPELEPELNGKGSNASLPGGLNPRNN